MQVVLDTEVLLRGLGCSRDRSAEGEHRGLGLLHGAQPTPGWVKAELKQGGHSICGAQVQTPWAEKEGPFSHRKDQPTLCFLQLPGVCLKLSHYRMQECTCTLAATALSLK